MKVVYVVDTIAELNSKIDLLKNRFGNNILYVVKSNLLSLFKTYGYQANAVYSRNLPRTITALLLPGNVDDVVICYASANITNNLLNEFIQKIGDKSKVVNVMPKYNMFERMLNSAYNVYVKSLFKIKDTMATPKLQFLPAQFVVELLTSHFANKMFELNPNYCKTLYIEDKAVNKSLKVKTSFNKLQLLPIIAFLALTIAFLAILAFTKVNYLIVLCFVLLYILDIVLAIIQQCKIYFDQRFMK